MYLSKKSVIFHFNLDNFRVFMTVLAFSSNSFGFIDVLDQGYWLFKCKSCVVGG